jgi:hypothetical protein
MTTTNERIYVKTMIWRGFQHHYVGYTPSRPEADSCSKLGSYFLKCDSFPSALAVARSFSDRVEVCEPFIGL